VRGDTLNLFTDARRRSGQIRFVHVRCSRATANRAPVVQSQIRWHATNSASIFPKKSTRVRTPSSARRRRWRSFPCCRGDLLRVIETDVGDQFFKAFIVGAEQDIPAQNA
jgi:hypothetical protein